MRTNRSVVGRPSILRYGRQTEGRVHTARGKGSFGLLAAIALLTLLAVTPAFAAGVTVSVSPNPAQVTPGSTVQLGATVSGTGDTLVIWSLSGPGCSGIACGTINSQGTYTAPATAPNPPTVTATATSLSDFTTTGNSTITIIPPPPVAITLSPGTVSVKPGAQQQFTVAVTGSKNTGVTWSIAGSGCVGFYCGLFDPNGVYTAPPQIPNPPTVTITAISNADSTKTASATITIGNGISVSVTPGNPAVVLGQQQAFGAAVTGSNNTGVTWSISSAGCAGSACGTISGTGVYTAPAVMPPTSTITITATAAADATKTGASTVTLLAAAGVTVQPASVHVLPGAQQPFSATVGGTGNQQVTWNLSGAGCTGVTCGTITATGIYTAPAKIPTPNLVSVKANSIGLPGQSGTASVFVGAASPINVTLTPSPAQVIVGQTQQFTAKVTGTNNTAVTWMIVGGGCEPNCGTISATGLFTAPPNPPTIPAVDVIAVSVADPTRSASSFVTIEQNVVVTVSPSPVALKTGAAQQFTATVSGSANRGVNWSVSGKGCTGATCGTITAAGLYTAPATAPNPAAVTITATSQSDPLASGTATVTIGTPIKVTVAPPTASVATGGQQKFTATVTGNANTAVNWSLTGPSCPNACGSINGTGEYTAPAAVPNSNVTVVATSQADGVSNGTATVTVTSKNEANLKGQYAFLFRGRDANGVYQAAGSFVADGDGNVTAGVEDINRISGPSTNLAFTGTYSVAGDNRGILVIKNAKGTFTYTFALGANGNRAHMVEADESGIRGSGVMERQTTADFSPFALNGGFALSLVGADAGGARLGALASIFPGGEFVSGSAIDVNDGGETLATITGFNGSFTIAANGRGTMALSIAGFGSGTFNFAIYIISSTEFYLVSTDPLSGGNPIFGGTAFSQTGSPFVDSSFKGNSTFYETGVSNHAPDVSAGLMTFDGNGAVIVGYDENEGGFAQIANEAAGTYTVSANGRTTINLTNTQTHAISTAIMYGISQNTAFIMDTSGSVRSGYLETLVVQPRFGDSDIVGRYTMGTAEAVAGASPLTTGALNFNGNGNVSGNIDQDLTGSTALNQLLNGTYAIPPSSTNGRGNMLLSLPQSQTFGIWLATYGRAYGIPLDASDTEPSIVILEQ
jgi:Fe-S cluster assembly iron-binding protein IscA